MNPIAGSTFVTYGGNRVTIHSGAPSLRAIAVSQSRIPRFCGNCDHYYPVLAHSFTTAYIMPEDVAIHGLLHDAQESVMSDVPTPMKTDATREIEDRILGNVYESLGLKWPLPKDIAQAVKDADFKCLLAEAHLIGYHGATELFGPVYDEAAGNHTKEYLRVGFRHWTPEYVSNLFISLYEDLREKMRPY